MSNKNDLEKSVDNLIACLLDSTTSLLSAEFDVAVEEIGYTNSIIDAIKKLQDIGVDIGIVFMSDKTSTTDTISQETKVVKEKKTALKKEVV